MKILLVIPCYNEEGNILMVVNEIRRELENIDYIVIDDGSTDNTNGILKKNGINHISLPVNCGLKAAFQTGIQWAMGQPVHYDAICQFDADGQHIPKYILEMQEVMEKLEADVVIGSRYKNCDTDGNIKKRLGRVAIIKLIYILTKKRITDPTSGLRMYKDTVYPFFIEDDNIGPEPDSIVYFLKKKYRVVEIAVKMNERIFGESYLTISESLKYMFNILSSILFLQWWR